MKKIITIIAGCLVSCSCFAATTYIGMDIGRSRILSPLTCSDLAAIFDPGYSCNLHDTGTTYGLFVGHKFLPNLSVELGYVDLGKFDITASGTVLGSPTSTHEELKAKGTSLSVVGDFPVTQKLLLLTRLGFFRWSADLDGTTTGGPLAGTTSKHASASEPLLGAGVQWDANQQMSLRGEWTRYTNIGDKTTTGQSDVDTFTISGIYNF